jgi:hypothetical protein
MTIGDTIWLATALLARQNPRAHGFSYETILRKVFELDASLKAVSVHAHLSSHCVASKRASPATLRILTENPDGTLRLFRAGDPFHTTRRGGRTQPKLHSVPEEFHSLLQPEVEEAPPVQYSEEDDPLLALTGVGKELWQSLGGGEAFIRAVRQEAPFTLRPHPPMPSSSPLKMILEKLANGKSDAAKKTPSRARSFSEVWPRIEAHEGEDFRTIQGKLFSYNIRGSAVVPRPGKAEETNRLLPRSDFQKAWDRRPLTGPGQIHDLQGPSYVYAILTDPRISGR